MSWKAIVWRAGMTDFTVWIAPLANVTVVIKSTVLAPVMFALLLVVSVLQMRVDLDTPEATIFILAATICSLAVPVNRPQYIVMVLATYRESSHGNILELPCFCHDNIFALSAVLRISGSLRV